MVVRRVTPRGSPWLSSVEPVEALHLPGTQNTRGDTPEADQARQRHDAQMPQLPRPSDDVTAAASWRPRRGTGLPAVVIREVTVDRVLWVVPGVVVSSQPDHADDTARRVPRVCHGRRATWHGAAVFGYLVKRLTPPGPISRPTTMSTIPITI
jgi:hypothetical protein